MDEAGKDEAETESRQDPPALVTKPIQESKSTLVNTISPKLEKLLYPLGKITHSSTITHSDVPKTSNEDQSAVERSLHLRRVRGKLYHELKGLSHSDIQGRRDIFAQGRERDRIAKEFLNQGDVKVNMPGLGEQAARYSVMNDDIKGRAVVIVPGISNDLDSIEGHAQETAARYNKVFALGYPEGYGGTVTEDFAKKVEEEGDLSTHAEFFKEAIKALTGDDEIELRGLSTGAPIVAQVLSDPEFSKRVGSAVLISPAASVDQSSISMNLGLTKDMRAFVHNFSDIAAGFVWFKDKVSGATQSQKDLRKRIMPVLQKAITKKSPYWGSMKVKEGGEITVVTGGKDAVTKSYKAEEEFLRNPQVRVVNMPNETHVGSFNSVDVLDKIEETQATEKIPEISDSSVESQTQSV